MAEPGRPKKTSRKKVWRKKVEVSRSDDGAEVRFVFSRGARKPVKISVLLDAGMAAPLLFALEHPESLRPGWSPPILKDPGVAPKVGDIIYVGTSMFMDHGEDDVRGGMGRVKSVKEHMSAGRMVPFVEVHEHPGRGGYNWEILAMEQEKLSEEFGNRWARPDPDPRPEFRYK